MMSPIRANIALKLRRRFPADRPKAQNPRFFPSHHTIGGLRYQRCAAATTPAGKPLRPQADCLGCQGGRNGIGMTAARQDELARELREAQRSPPPVPLNDRLGATDLGAGYAVQAINVGVWASEGRRVAGRKAALTAAAQRA